MKTGHFIGIIIGVVIVIVMTFVFRPKNERKQSETPCVQVIENPKLDGWELIGERGGCRLYMKLVPTNGMTGYRVFWTICNPNGPNTATSVSTE